MIPSEHVKKMDSCFTSLKIELKSVEDDGHFMHAGDIFAREMDIEIDLQKLQEAVDENLGDIE